MTEELKAFKELQHISPLKFSTDVISLAETHNMGYFECVQYYCQKYDIEIETVKSFITPVLLDKLVDEGEKNNTIKRSGRLDL